MPQNDSGIVMGIEPAEVLRGGVEVTAGLPQMILEVLKNVAQGTGEVLHSLSPYALKALETYSKLKAMQASSNAAYADEIRKT